MQHLPWMPFKKNGCEDSKIRDQNQSDLRFLIPWTLPDFYLPSARFLQTELRERTLVTMPYSSSEKLKDPADSSVISCCFRPVSNRLLNSRNLRSVTKVFCRFSLQLVWKELYRKKEKLRYSTFFRSCLVNKIWTFSCIGLITWSDWKTHHHEMTMWFPKQWASSIHS